MTDDWNIILRLSTSLTGLPNCRAAATRKRTMRPRPELAAETRADKLGDDAHVFLRQSKHLREDAAKIEDALRLFVNRQHLAIPDCDGRLQFDGIVRLGRRDVGLIDLDRCACKSVVGIAAFALQALGRTERSFDRRRARRPA